MADSTTKPTNVTVIANVDTSTIDGTWGTEEDDVLTDVRTKLDLVLEALRVATIIGR